MVWASLALVVRAFALSKRDWESFGGLGLAILGEEGDERRGVALWRPPRVFGETCNDKSYTEFRYLSIFNHHPYNKTVINRNQFKYSYTCYVFNGPPSPLPTLPHTHLLNLNQKFLHNNLQRSILHISTHLLPTLHLARIVSPRTR
ncbi:hypothetical protein DID88_010374 [Monilinia fructigena]|uniref:Secreted protein n=1 Tax=Monilinia fructigena TaxID=38457 RepID=A0A395ILZ2_9HELO|nr:hypothetical protein DID88_010374 [Monilinia fructigena]